MFQSLQDLIVRAAHLRAISVRALLHTQVGSVFPTALRQLLSFWYMPWL